MSLYYQRLSSGYHYVRDGAAAHCFAQWKIGTALTVADISHNGLSAREQIAFVQRAVDLAGSQRLENIGG